MNYFFGNETVTKIKIKKISVDLLKICLNSFMNKNDKNINAISRANDVLSPDR